MQYLVDIDAVFLHVVPVVDLTPLRKLHGEDPLCAQVPVDDGNLWKEESFVFFSHIIFITDCESTTFSLDCIAVQLSYSCAFDYRLGFRQTAQFRIHFQD